MKRNLSSYFFKKSWAHYSFGQMLVSGVLAVAIGTSTIGGSAAAAVAIQSASQSGSVSSSSSEIVATPAPTPEEEEKTIDTSFLEMAWYESKIGEPEEIEPDVEVILSTGGSQQKLSIGVYTKKYDENGYSWNEIIIGVPMEVTIVCDELAELEDEDNATGNAASVEGAISVYDISTSSGTFQLGEIDPGEYTVSLSCEYDNYIMPEPVTVTVVEKISYEVDEEIEMEEEEAGFEDVGTEDTTVVEDTVRYVSSSNTSVSYTMYEVTKGEYWTDASTGKKYLYFSLNGVDYFKSAYEITTGTTTIDGVTYEYYASVKLDTSLTVDGDGVVDTSNITVLSANTSTGSTSAATTMQLASTATTSYDNANFSGLAPLSLSVGSGASTGKAYTTANTLSTVATKTLVVSSDDTSYGFMTINEDENNVNSINEGDETQEAVNSESSSSSDSVSNDSSSNDSSSNDSSSSDSSSSDSSSSDSSSSDSSSSDSSSSDSSSSDSSSSDSSSSDSSSSDSSSSDSSSSDSSSSDSSSSDSSSSDSSSSDSSDSSGDSTPSVTSYTVTYSDGLEGAVFTSEVYSDLEDGAATPAFAGSTTRTGYTFSGWSTNADTTVTTLPTTVTADVTYTAVWVADTTSGSTSTDTSKWTQSVTLYSSNAAANSSVTINGKSYTASTLFGISVDTVTVYTYSGWQVINNIRYYYDPDTNKPVTGTQVIEGTTYLFGSNGAYDSQCTGIDVSYWQGSIDWDKVKAAGVEFVIIRAGYRGYSSGTIVQDVNFTSYITGAKAAGLRVGIYFFSQAINAKEGVEEASACINLIKAYGTSYPIYIDTELSGASGNSGRADNISNADRTAAVVAFCETIKSAGYTPGIYASYSWFTSKLNFSEVSGYSLWNAQWGSTNSMGSAGMWQYTSDGSVNGISGRVDMNVSYIG